MYVESSDTLSLYLDNVKVKKGDYEYLVPIGDLHTIILDNYKILLSVHLINALTKANVNLVLCNVEHMPQAILRPISGNSSSPLILKRQIEWDNIIKSKIHRLIVVNKINNQIHILKKHQCDVDYINKIHHLMLDVEYGDLTNREGLAAKMYFRSLFGPEFKRFNDDIINSGLNYGYAVLRSQISKAIIAKGLNPELGIFHIGRNNLFNLSDDFIEPFRPIIDDWVKKNLVNAEMFTREHRLEIVKQTLINVNIKQQSQSLFNAINIFIDSIIKCFDENDEKYYETISLSL